MQKVLQFRFTAAWVREAVVVEIEKKTEATAHVYLAGPINCERLSVTAKTYEVLDKALKLIKNDSVFRVHFEE